MHSLPVETLSLPTPYAVGPVNAYVIPVEPMTMIDAGVNTVEAENALKLGFAARGMFLESVERILITHGHPDHYGLIPVVQEVSNAQAHMGKAEVERITDTRDFWELRRLLMEAGFPEQMQDTVVERERRLQRLHRVEGLDCKTVSHGEWFEFRDFRLEAVSLPGHTGGHVGYFEPESATLFAGDTLFPDIGPALSLGPILEPEGESPTHRRQSLKQYLDSLERLESMELKRVYPGHGPVITDPQQTIAYMREHYARRLDVVAATLGQGGKTAYEVSVELYPPNGTANGAHDPFLAVSEVIAHLDVLVEQGRARLEVSEQGAEYFSLA